MSFEIRVNGKTVKEYKEPVTLVEGATKLGAKFGFRVSEDEGVLDILVHTVGTGDLKRASDVLVAEQQAEGKRREKGKAGERPVADVGTAGQGPSAPTAK